MQRRLSAVQEAGFPCLVAGTETGPESESTNNNASVPVVVGYAYAGPFRPRPAYRFTVQHSVYVAATQRSRGVGRLLMEALIAQCERSGRATPSPSSSPIARCINAVSNHRPNLYPDRSILPTSLNPMRSCNATEAIFACGSPMTPTICRNPPPDS
jgi:GNAT superfamily N-acetyltransferase